MKWGFVYNGDALTIRDMRHFAPMAEQAGADTIWTAEAWRDAFVPLTAVAGTLKTMRVGTAIAQMARPPVLTALSAQSMAEYTDGRFVLGVGTAPRDWNINWHNFDVPKPIPHIRDYIKCVRAVLNATPDNPASYVGSHYKVTDYLPFMSHPIGRVPIYLAAVNPHMIQLSGSHTDGVILGPLNSMKYLKEVVHPNLAKGIARSGRTRSAVELCAMRICAVDADRGRAKALARHGIAFFCLLAYYDIVLTPLGFDRQVLAIRDAFGRRDIPGMLSAVTCSAVRRRICHSRCEYSPRCIGRRKIVRPGVS
jgi:alkanesulfonate monooxygenase SsuD/methylene tetrahydromethanopterin reductase-like flavin-dependent oxidoreductase (luciferase family)